MPWTVLGKVADETKTTFVIFKKSKSKQLYLI